MRFVLTLALLPLTACHSAPAQQTRLEVPSTIEELMRDVHERTRANFTYSDEIGEQMRQCDIERLRFSYPPEDSLSVLGIVLVINGFSLVREGPETSNEWQIVQSPPSRRRSGRVRLQTETRSIYEILRVPPPRGYDSLFWHTELVQN